MNIQNELQRYNLKVDQYSILRKPNGRPCCNNDLLEAVVRKKLEEGLSAEEELLYGYLLMTLARIVINNKAIKYQEESLRMECFSEALTVMADVERNFKWDHGSKLYSYMFNAMYHACIHVLEQSNKRRALIEAIQEKRTDEYLDCGCKIGPVCASTAPDGGKLYYTRCPD